MAASNIPAVRRKLKNVAYNYTPTQIKVREATSNDPWGPSSSLMSEIADLTHNTVAFSEVMEMVWKRINDHGKNWRHVYKGLVVIDYLIKCGSDKVAQQCKENIFTIETLKDFQHIEDNKDQGHNIRTKATQLVSLLKDDEKLKNERAKSLMARKRFAQNNMGISSQDGQGPQPRTRVRNDSEFEEARPASIGEEELQLQIALALSREEADREQDERKGDDVRLQLAMEESKKNESLAADQSVRSTSPLPGTSQSALDDLLGLTAPPPAANDPWAPPANAAEHNLHMNMPPPPQYTPNNVVPGLGTPVNNDPWAPQHNGGAAGNDPWSSNATAITNVMLNTNNQLQSPGHNNGLTTEQAGALNEWSVDNMLDMGNTQPIAAMGGMNGQHQVANQQMADQRKNLKTPETFLGENSSLVNLNDLLGPSKPVTAKPPVNNPFLSSTTSAFNGTGGQTGNLSTTTGAGGASLSASGGGSNTPNPFAAQQRPSPTLNQMRTENIPGKTPIINNNNNSNSSSNMDNWSHGLPDPMQPQRPMPAATNPFM